MWSPLKEYLYRVIRSDRVMIRWILVLSQQHSPDDLRRKLQIQHIEEMISWDSRRILDAGGGSSKCDEGWRVGGD